MNRFLIAAALTAVAFTTPAFAADVNFSLNIGQPDFYGRLDIGDYPPPQVIYRRPMIIEQVEEDRPPVYLRVPPRHARHWSRYCREYEACGERVFFVQDNWYNREYVPRYREQHRDHRDEDRKDDSENDDEKHHGHGRGHGDDR